LRALRRGYIKGGWIQMKYKSLGDTGVTVSRVILGCWQMGGDYFGRVEDSASEACIREALSCGVTTFDTAYSYGDGRSEEVLGRVLEGRRQDCTIMTKLRKASMGKEDVVPECEGALRRLRTDVIDVYFLESPSGTVPIGETMEELNKLREQGKIRAVGLSNFSLEQMQEAMSYGKIDVIQPCYGLLWRFIDRDVLPFCIENGISVIPYGSLGQGLLTGNVRPNTVFRDGRAHAPLFDMRWRTDVLKVADAVRPISKRYCCSRAQIALNWVLQTPGITAVIAGANRTECVSDNARASDFTLALEDYKRLNRFSRNFMGKIPRYKSFFGSAIED